MKLLVVVTLAVAGCSTGPAAIERPTATPHAFEQAISKGLFGDDWPFTVADGTLMCQTARGRPLVTFDSGDGIEYALNGAAVDFGFPELDKTVLTDYPNKSGVLPLIKVGLTLCE